MPLPPVSCSRAKRLRAGVASAATPGAPRLGRWRGGASLVILPIGFLIIQRATLYDGIRHVLFVIPMLAILAGFGFWALLPLLGRAPVIAAVAVGAYVGGTIGTLAALHPLERLHERAHRRDAGSVRQVRARLLVAGGDGGLRRLERRLDYDPAVRAADSSPSILICIPWREHLVNPMLGRPWNVVTDPEQAEFIIATERSRCADNQSVVLIDEVKRFDRTFAWVYARRAGDLYYCLRGGCGAARSSGAPRGSCWGIASLRKMGGPPGSAARARLLSDRRSAVLEVFRSRPPTRAREA
jgi:hypothetical protein